MMITARSRSTFFAGILLLSLAAPIQAQSVRELIPTRAPAGARVLVAGNGLADDRLAVAFGALPATVVARAERYLEVIVPAAASSGDVRLSLGNETIAALPFTVTEAPAYTVTTVAGGPRTANHPLKHPMDVAVVTSWGLIAVADEQDHRILLITPDGITAFLAGSGLQGFRDGKGSEAQFKAPAGIVFDAKNRRFFVSDSGNNAIRMVTLEGEVTTIAGGTRGFADGVASAARFDVPAGLTIGPDGALYVADSMNHAIRRVSIEGQVTTFAGGRTKGSKDGAAADATFNTPRDIAAAGGAFYVADTSNDVIRTIAGGTVATLPVPGLRRPSGVELEESGDLLVADSFSDMVRRIVLHDSSNSLRTVAGSGRNGWADGSPAVAEFKHPVALSVAGAVYVADEDNDALRALCPAVSLEGAYLPSTFTAGSELWLFGTGFVPGATTVLIDGVPSEAVGWISSTRITASLPRPISGGSVAVSIASCGGTTPARSFVVDMTPPVIAIEAPAAGALLTSPNLTVRGQSDDATSISVNGVPAVIDPATHSFAAEIVLLEGPNTIVASGPDWAGNVGTASIAVQLDTRAPELSIAPIPACTSANAIELRGTVFDPRIERITAALGGATANAALEGRAWSVTLPAPGEGKSDILVQAFDSVGHVASRVASTMVDRTPPAVSILERGVPFEATIVGRSVLPSVTLSDADRDATALATLNGQPLALPAEVADDGAYVLRVVARDCAGNESSTEHAFTIDLKPPEFVSFEPANGAKLSTVPNALRGNVDSDAVEVRSGGRSVSVSGGAFTLMEPGFTEGTNELTLEAVDAAGHVGRATYRVSIRTSDPVVDIVEEGSPIVEGSVFNRPVTPHVRIVDPLVTFTATVNGAPFASGTTLSADGPYVISATATDPQFGRSKSITRAFSVDRSGPSIQVVSPVPGSALDTDRVDVVISAPDAVAVTVNGRSASKNGDRWIASGVPLEQGENSLVAAANDTAGNTSAATVSVSRVSPGPSIALTFPPDPFLTNRPSIDVVGSVRRPGSTVTVTVAPDAPVAVAVDPAGGFRLPGVALTEGERTIVATARGEDGTTTSVSARVTADFTPPLLRLLESGAPLASGAVFDERAEISAETLAAVSSKLLLDGVVTQSPVTVTERGGHVALLIGRDAAGNETRLERSFSIGAAAGPAGCDLQGFDPADGATISAVSVTLVGRSGGAAGVRVNGVPAVMSNGSFRATVELPQEGANRVVIVCTDASGAAVGNEVPLTLYRATGEPTVAIVSPDEGGVRAAEQLQVRGTAGNGAISVEVNGKAATLADGRWSVDGIRLQEGVNLVVARARSASGRTATVSRRVVRLADLPSLSISSPLTGVSTGGSTTDVSGTWSNVDPGSIAVTPAGSIEKTVWSDTTGSFVARGVPLNPGENLVVVTGADRLGRTARAEISIPRRPGAPSIQISAPEDNRYFGAAQETFRVTGTFADAAEGSSVEVNGVAATVDATAATFAADVAFSTLSAGVTPVVARLTTPAGEGAIDTIRVFKRPAAPEVLSVFPADDAVGADPGAVVLVLFSAPMDGQSLLSEFRLEDSAGHSVNGLARVDKDVLTFAPASLMEPGSRYTVRVSTGAKDIAGQQLASAFAASFTVASTAPAGAPVITTPAGPFCGTTIDVAGSAPPLATVRIEYGNVPVTTNASAAGSFSYRLPLSGQQGFQRIVVRVVGKDGALSAPAELTIDVGCDGPRVLSATFDRGANRLSLVFSAAMEAGTLTAGASGSLQLVLDDARVIGGSVASSGAGVTVVPSEDLSAAAFTLKVTRTAADVMGRTLQQEFVQRFEPDGETSIPGDGRGSISGEIFDGAKGRPLAGASVTIDAPVAAFGDSPRALAAEAAGAFETTATLSLTTDSRGRYAARLDEGAHVVKVSAKDHTTVWRQVVVPAGAGVIPIDIRLEARGESKSIATGETVLAHQSSVAPRATLTIPAGGGSTGAAVTLTAVGAQSLAGLLPLGWSPLASAEIAVEDGTLTTGTLAFEVPQADIDAAVRTLTAVAYDETRDEWRVLVPTLSATAGSTSFAIDGPGAYAVVFGDQGARLASPPLPVQDAMLRGVIDRCASGDCPQIVATRFPLDPEKVLPSGTSVARLEVEGGGEHVWPSGTPVEAWIDEELRLADGGRETQSPFATDLVLYRNVAGDTGVASFVLAPSERASEVLLEVGFENVRVEPYPGQLDRGTLIGPEGGRVPSEGGVAVEIPAGATQVELRASARAITDPGRFGPIAGFSILAGVELAIQGSGADTDDEAADLEVSQPARATFVIDESSLTSEVQLILVEVLGSTSYGTSVFRMAAELERLDGGLWTTRSIDRARLPLDGIMREGRYLVLAAVQPVAFAMGVVRSSASGVVVSDAQVSAPPLGVTDVSRVTGIFVVPVPAAPATAFTLLPRTRAWGEGAGYAHPSAPGRGDVVDVGALLMAAQPPVVVSTLPAAGAVGVAPGTNVQIRFSRDIATAAVSITGDGSPVAGNVTVAGPVVTWQLPAPRPDTFPEFLNPGTRYTVVVSPDTKGVNGAAMSAPFVFSFTTAAVSTSLDPAKIRITIPDESGECRIIGEQGALTGGWVAAAVRRRRDFTNRPQAQVSGDGSFVIPLAGIATTDLIDLRVVNDHGALVAVIPLPMFVREDRRAFIAPVASGNVRFTSVDGISVVVPQGAFDQPTLVEVLSAPRAALDGIPKLEQELEVGPAAELRFDGIAREKLTLELPAAGLQTGGTEWFLTLLGQSVRGPRLMAVDLLHASGGDLVTGTAPAGGASRIAVDSLPGEATRDRLLGVQRSGIYAPVSLRQAAGSLGWAAIDGIQRSFDLFWDTLESLYAAHFYLAESRGRIAIPVLANRQFQIVGVDAATGLEAYTKVYDPIPIADPGVSVTIPNPDPDVRGPYPVFGTPFRIESADVSAEGVAIESVRDFVLKLENGVVSVATTLPQGIVVTIMNTSSGLVVVRDHETTVTIAGSVGDRLVLIVEQTEVDPFSPLSIVFSEPLSIPEGGIEPLLQLQVRSGSTWYPVPVTGVDADSGGRRFTIGLPASLTRGARYRLRIAPQVSDPSGNHLGAAGGSTGLAEPLYVPFRVRQPGGVLGTFDLVSGRVRDQALNGNLLLVSAMEGGIQAFDVSDPAAIGSAQMIGRTAESSDEYWAIASDRHGRVFATSTSGDFGMLRTFRLDDFLPTAEGTVATAKPRGGSMLSWLPGSAAALNLASRAILGDRPEAIPRKLQVLLQDEEHEYRLDQNDEGAWSLTHTDTLPIDAALTSFTIGGASPAGDGLRELELEQQWNPGRQYAVQRVTVENATLDLHWSGEAVYGTPAKLTGIVAREGDLLRVVVNDMTYGVISLFGFGVGVWDLNAVESNDSAVKPPGYTAMREAVKLTDGAIPDGCPQPPEDAHFIPDLTYTPDAALLTRPGSSDINVFALDLNRGVLDLTVKPPTEETAGDSPESTPCNQRPLFGLVFRDRDTAVHPRLEALRVLFEAKAHRNPAGRFTGVAHYRWRLEAADNHVTTAPGAEVQLGRRGSIPNTAVTRDYLLLPAFEYGLLVVDAGGDKPPLAPEYDPLQAGHLADIVWIPNGAAAVRIIPRTTLAAVVDGQGYVLLVDLGRIDERWDETGAIPSDQLFPTAAAVLAAGLDVPDPRIVWRSSIPLASGTLAPVVDADTGLVFAGRLLEQATSVVAAVDPRIQVKADVGAAAGLSEIGGIVPLGVAPPANVLTGSPNASLAAFRLEVTLPGSITQQLGGHLVVAVESERVAGAVTEQTPAGFPRSHLRRVTRGGTPDPRANPNFVLTRAVPESLAGQFRHQKGYNKFVSPWIVAVADPRASEEYTWAPGASKLAAGCTWCDRPQRLRGKSEADGVWELFTNGRLVAVRPDLCASGGSDCSSNIFTGTPYAYLGGEGRFVTRFSTVMADTVRPTPVLVAAQQPPVADGVLQETTYLHSGEVEVANVDLDAGGRSGWNAVFDRTYRSRTVGSTLLGQGWDASVFRRIRALPNGDVEYRDGAGELWLFKLSGGAWVAPRGLALRLGRDERGWLLVDQKGRIAGFDLLGRLAFESDEFAPAPWVSDKGNVIRYLYDPSGRLAQVVDPVGRATLLSYYADDDPNAWRAGRLKKITDWRNRQVEYEYDLSGRLMTAKLPAVSGTTPQIRYGYDATSSSTPFNDSLELVANLRTITDPLGGAPRVTFVYGTGADRDRVVRQEWTATGEAATFAWVGGFVTTEDALKQQRTYQLTPAPADANADRVHVSRLDELAVDTATAEFGTLPSASVASAPRAPKTRTFLYSYCADNECFCPDGAPCPPEACISAAGWLKSVTLEGVKTTTYLYKNAAPAPGVLVRETATTPSPAAAGAIASQSMAAPLVRRFEYDHGWPKKISIHDASGIERFVNRPVLRANQTSSTTVNDAISAATGVDLFGRLEVLASSGGTDTDSAGSRTSFRYLDAGAPIHALGELSETCAGSEADCAAGGVGGLRTKVSYSTANSIETTDERNVTTKTELDEWLRPKKVTTPGAGVDLTTEYDANGRVTKSVRKQDPLTVTETLEYDAIGRVKKATTDNVAVGAGLSTIESTVEYDLPGRKVVRKLPGGAVVTEILDGLGRVTTRKTVTGSSDIEENFAYDLDGNLVYSADNHVATASAFDVEGRQILTLHPDQTKTRVEYDPAGGAKRVERLDAGGNVFAESAAAFTASGRAQSSETKIADGVTRTMTTAWDGAGRVSAVASEGRASKSSFDLQGRHVSDISGGGSLSAITTAFRSTKSLAWDGALTAKATIGEKSVLAAGSVQNSYDKLARPTQEKLGSLEWVRSFDQAGNVTSAAPPEREPTTFESDARGKVTSETKPGDVQIQHGYTAAGAPSSYEDPVGEVTSTTTDYLGRPRVRSYVDGTTELFEYDGPRLLSMTDRQGRTFVYDYNEKGQLAKVRRNGGEILEEMTYDAAGRLTKHRTADAALVYEDFDLEGRPRRTRQIRYAQAWSATVLNEFVQEHGWNVHGERSSWTMPLPPGTGPGWTAQVEETRDAAGNVEQMTRTMTGPVAPAATFLSSDYRGAGRANHRTLTTAAGASIVRTYGYEEGTARLNDLTVTAGGVVVAGSEVTFDGLQVAKATLHGVSGGARANRYQYDALSRLASSRAAVDTESDAASSQEMVDPADFRTALERPQDEPAALPSLTFGQLPGHKIGTIERGGEARTVSYLGAERVDDGRFVYEFDARGRLVRATEKLPAGSAARPLRRIRYSWAPSDRVVGRIAEYGTPGAGGTVPDAAWTLEDRPDILGDEAVPAHATFVWDPITDRLIEVVDAQTGQLVRQIIHGDLAYDDPLEVAVAEEGTAHRLYPVFDEAAAGNLQVVLNEQGEVVQRSVMEGAYGEDELALSGAAIDRIAVQAKKDADGQLAGVSVSLRSTEALAEASLAEGARLAVLASDGRVVRSFPDPATLFDNESFTLRWDLTPAQWSTLTEGTGTEGGPVTLSIAITDALRAASWPESSTFLPPPDWALAGRPLHTRAGIPLEYREPLAALDTWLSALAPGETADSTLYTAPALGSMGGREGSASKAIVVAGFQALPFAEPATGLVYARARWYDPATGAFLTPDPMGYVDSSNLYAFAGGDPVNRRDPTGEDAYDDKLQAYIAWFADQHDALWQTRKQLSSQLSGPDPGLAIAEDRIAASRMMMFGGNADSAAVFIDFARARGNRAVLGMSNEQIHAELVKDEGVKAVGAALIGGLRPGLAQLQSKFSSGWKALGEAVGDVVDFRWGSRAASQRGSVTIRKGPGSFVPKKESMRPSAAQYQEDVGEGLPGHAYRVPYDNPNPRGKPYVDYDGVQGTFPVDAKLAVVTRPKTVGQAMRQADSLRQTSSKGIWKAPNMSEALRARRVIREANATDVLFVVVERKP